LKLLHFHIGSQVPDILTVKKAVQEAARFYAKLYKMGFAIEYLDVGGGLGVDYDGSRSAFDSSTNYSLQEYTNDIVYYIADVCNAEKVPHPDIVSESGRAIVAHHSVLIVEVFGSIDEDASGRTSPMGENEHALVRNCSTSQEHRQAEQARGVSRRAGTREDAQQMFTLGLMDLPDKAKIESLYWEISEAVVELQRPGLYPGGNPEARGQPGRPVSLQLLRVPIAAGSLGAGPALPHHADQPADRTTHARGHPGGHHVRFRRPDQQVHRSARRPRHPAVAFAQLNHQRHGKQEPYYIGFFLMGAYQDIMGDLHNLFGRVNEVHVFLDPDEPTGYYVEEIIEGTTIVQALSSVQYDENELKRQMKAQVDTAIKSDRMKPSEAMRLLDDYERGLKAYTYLTIGGSSSHRFAHQLGPLSLCGLVEPVSG
jgi:arginine decarboxylase